MPKSSLKGKISIKITFTIISIYSSFIKSLANGVYGTNIIILDPLEAQHIKKLPLTMYFWFVSDRSGSIYKNYDFCIQNPCLHKYEYIIPFKMFNNGWNWSVHMSLLMNDDISAYFLCEKLSYFSFSTF